MKGRLEWKDVRVYDHAVFMYYAILELEIKPGLLNSVVCVDSKQTEKK